MEGWVCGRKERVLVAEAAGGPFMFAAFIVFDVERFPEGRVLDVDFVGGDSYYRAWVGDVQLEGLLGDAVYY